MKWFFLFAFALILIKVTFSNSKCIARKDWNFRYGIGFENKVAKIIQSMYSMLLKEVWLCLYVSSKAICYGKKCVLFFSFFYFSLFFSKSLCFSYSIAHSIRAVTLNGRQVQKYAQSKHYSSAKPLKAECLCRYYRRFYSTFYRTLFHMHTNTHTHTYTKYYSSSVFFIVVFLHRFFFAPESRPTNGIFRFQRNLLFNTDI